MLSNFTAKQDLDKIGTRTDFWQCVIFKIKYQFFGIPGKYTK